jgi:general secretion pathway protein J
VSGPPPARGFTLIELLIALAMIALITLLMFSGLRLGSRAWEGVNAAGERVGRVRLAHGFLARTLAQARPAATFVDGGAVNVFAGDAERLELAAPLSEYVGLPGIYILRLTLEGRGDDLSLVLTRWLMHPEVLAGMDDVPAWEPLLEDAGMALDSVPLGTDLADGAFGRTLLLEDVSEFEIAYFGLAEGEDEPDWHEEWAEQPRLPLLVRIRLTTLDQGWPDLIVALPGGRT